MTCNHTKERITFCRQKCNLVCFFDHIQRYLERRGGVLCYLFFFPCFSVTMSACVPGSKLYWRLLMFVGGQRSGSDFLMFCLSVCLLVFVSVCLYIHLLVFKAVLAHSQCLLAASDRGVRGILLVLTSPCTLSRWAHICNIFIYLCIYMQHIFVNFF